jgi:hypothetical protein
VSVLLRRGQSRLRGGGAGGRETDEEDEACIWGGASGEARGRDEALEREQGVDKRRLRSAEVILPPTRPSKWRSGCWVEEVARWEGGLSMVREWEGKGAAPIGVAAGVCVAGKQVVSVWRAKEGKGVPLGSGADAFGGELKVGQVSRG